MGPTDLTESTIRYLFATSWLPTADKEHTVAVPGGETTAIDTAANLLHIAMWNLRRLGYMEFEQVRPVEKEPLRVLGGRSFSHFELRDRTVRMAGLEGALLGAAAGLDRDEHGLRPLIRALDLDNRSPWTSVCNRCFGEANGAGLVGVKGSRFFGQKVVITDPAAVESLRERHDELRNARGDYLTAEPDLIDATTSDCLRTIIDAYSPSLGD